MAYKRTYTFNRDNSNGYEPTDILVQYYESEQFRAVALRKDDWLNYNAWDMCSLLQRAYDAGREDQLRDIRMMLGVEK
jgi:hypothetical protein